MTTPAADGAALVCWRCQTLADVPATDDWLSVAERAVLAGLRVPKRRADWRLGRWTGKCAVRDLFAAQCPAHQPATAAIEILATESGAPEVWIGGARAALSISLSHSAGRALCALGPPRLALGCDLEAIAPREAVFVEDYFTTAERRLIAAASPVDRPWLVTLVWSAKESALKAMRDGLRRDTRDVAVVVNPVCAPEGAAPSAPGGSAWRPLMIDDHERGQRLTGWWRRDPAFVLTIVSEVPFELPRKGAQTAERIARF
jgi:4'-phosphopantetheinyl transferase